jgi:hypothetical protein
MPMNVESRACWLGDIKNFFVLDEANAIRGVISAQ